METKKCRRMSEGEESDYATVAVTILSRKSTKKNNANVGPLVSPGLLKGR